MTEQVSSNTPNYHLSLWNQVINLSHIRANEDDSAADIAGWKRATIYIRDNMFHPGYRLQRHDLENINKSLFPDDLILPRSSEWGVQVAGVVTPKVSGERKQGFMAVSWEHDSAIKISKYQTLGRIYAIQLNMSKRPVDLRLVRKILLDEGYITPSSTNLSEMWNRYTVSSMSLIGSYIAPPISQIDILMSSFITQFNLYQTKIENGDIFVLKSALKLLIGELSRIHPYVKGNGRVIRLLCNWLMVYYDNSLFSVSNEDLNIMIDKSICHWFEHNIKDLLGPNEPSYIVDYSDPNWDTWLQHIHV